ncbi:AAA family ATPase [Aquimarina sp. 2201CG1-2-11]|uniref:AAA family ATPase n=1 Tax=Aquimarina discodermiae TaxID=3231043 RepID=UPI003461E5B1
MKLENQLAKEVKNLLFCDTNLLELKVYSETHYNGSVPQILDKTSLENKYDLYLLNYFDLRGCQNIPYERDRCLIDLKSVYKNKLL